MNHAQSAIPGDKIESFVYLLYVDLERLGAHLIFSLVHMKYFPKCRFYRRNGRRGMNWRLSRSLGVTEGVYPKGCPDNDYIYVFRPLKTAVKGSTVQGDVVDNVYNWQECGEQRKLY